MISIETRKITVNSKLRRRRGKKQWPVSKRHHKINLESLMRANINSKPNTTFIGGYLNMLQSGHKTVTMPVP
jgi:hypothetical protein